MKKLLFPLVILLIFSFLITSCGGDETTTTTSSTATTTTTMTSTTTSTSSSGSSCRVRPLCPFRPPGRRGIVRRRFGLCTSGPSDDGGSEELAEFLRRRSSRVSILAVRRVIVACCWPHSFSSSHRRRSWLRVWALSRSIMLPAYTISNLLATRSARQPPPNGYSLGTAR